MPRVNVDGPPAPDHHDPGPMLQHLEVVAKVYVRQVLDYHIKAWVSHVDMNKESKL